MKKILIIHHSGVIGGAGVSLIHAIKSINQKEYKVVVLCPEEPLDMVNALKNENCEVISSRKSPKIFNHYNGGISHALSIKTVKNFFDILFDYKKIKQVIISVNPDVVMVNSMTLFWVGKVVKELDKKSICFHRETYQKGLMGFRSKIIKLGLSKWFDSVVYISKNDLRETGKISGDAKVIYDRVDISAFNNISREDARKKLHLDDNYKYVLYLGGMSKLKGADLVMKSMKYVDDSIKLIFIHESNGLVHPQMTDYDDLKGKLKFLLNKDIKKTVSKIYKKDDLCEKVIFRKRTTNPELYYKACDLVVFPSSKPHQSRPIYEAGVSQIPILITNFNQTSEFAKDGITAFTFKNGDFLEFADKINKIILGEFETSGIIKENYLQSINNHNLDTLPKEIEELLFEIYKS